LDFVLAYQDSCSFFSITSLNQSSATPGLAKNVIPISPVTKIFVVIKDGSRITVHRTQLPLTLAYAFTDYRSQRQSPKPVIVDIGPPSYVYLTSTSHFPGGQVETTSIFKILTRTYYNIRAAGRSMASELE
jgi:hypothetical protein